MFGATTGNSATATGFGSDSGFGKVFNFARGANATFVGGQSVAARLAPDYALKPPPPQQPARVTPTPWYQQPDEATVRIVCVCVYNVCLKLLFVVALQPQAEFARRRVGRGLSHRPTLVDFVSLHACSTTARFVVGRQSAARRTRSNCLRAACKRFFFFCFVLYELSVVSRCDHIYFQQNNIVFPILFDLCRKQR